MRGPYIEEGVRGGGLLGGPYIEEGVLYQGDGGRMGSKGPPYIEEGLAGGVGLK